MMITVTNYASGELLIANQLKVSWQLSRDEAHRLVMAARMHTVESFVKNLTALIRDEKLRQEILEQFSQAERDERWKLKEKIARLRTVTKGYKPEDPKGVVETVTLAAIP